MLLLREVNLWSYCYHTPLIQVLWWDLWWSVIVIAFLLCLGSLTHTRSWKRAGPHPGPGGTKTKDIPDWPCKYVIGVRQSDELHSIQAEEDGRSIPVSASRALSLPNQYGSHTKTQNDWRPSTELGWIHSILPSIMGSTSAATGDGLAPTRHPFVLASHLAIYSRAAFSGTWLIASVHFRLIVTLGSASVLQMQTPKPCSYALTFLGYLPHGN